MPATFGAAVLLFAATGNVQAGAGLEARTGQAPIIPGEDPRSASVGAVAPMVGASINGTSGDLRLSYRPRLTWYVVSGKAQSKPFVLHYGELSGVYRPSRGVSWNAQASITTGDVDYTALARVLGTQQSALPDVSGFRSISGLVGNSTDFGHGWRLFINLEGSRRETLLSSRTPAATEPDPLGPPPPPPPGQAGGLNFPTETTVVLSPTLSYGWISTDSVELRPALGYLWLSTGAQYATVTPQVAWRHLFGRADSLRLGAGFTYAKPTSQATAMAVAADAPPPLGAAVAPLAEAALTLELYRERGLILSGVWTAATTWFFDPVLYATAKAGDAAPAGNVGTTSLAVQASLPPDWTVSLDASFSTSLRSQPQGNLDETSVAVNLPVRYLISPNLNLEMGARWADRAPHFKSDNFRFHQREVWIYATLIATIGTERPPSRRNSGVAAPTGPVPGSVTGTTGTTGAITTTTEDATALGRGNLPVDSRADGARIDARSRDESGTPTPVTPPPFGATPAATPGAAPAPAEARPGSAGPTQQPR